MEVFHCAVSMCIEEMQRRLCACAPRKVGRRLGSLFTPGRFFTLGSRQFATFTSPAGRGQVSGQLRRRRRTPLSSPSANPDNTEPCGTQRGRYRVILQPLALSQPSRRVQQGHAGVYSRASRGRLAVCSGRLILQLSGRQVQNRGRRWLWWPAMHKFKQLDRLILSRIQSFHPVAGRCWVFSLRRVDLQEDTSP